MLRGIFYGIVVLVGISGVFCDSGNGKNENGTSGSGRSLAMGVKELAGCVELRNMRCFLDVAQDMVDTEKQSLLVLSKKSHTHTGRADDSDDDPDSSTHLTAAISDIMTELTDVVKSGIAGFFRDAKDDDDDDDEEDDEAKKDLAEEEEDDDEDEDRDQKSRNVVTSRKRKHKKKIHPLIAKIKLLIAGAVLAVKLIIILKLIATHLQIKFLMIAFAGLILNAARFYLDLKKGHHPQKVIYYEHAQHQHHYDGGEEDWSSGPAESPWGRSYELEDGKTAQDVAYGGYQKPNYGYEKKEEKPSFSLWG